MTSLVQKTGVFFVILCLNMTSAEVLEEYKSERGALNQLLLDGNDVLVGGVSLILRFRNSTLSAEMLEHTKRLPCRPGIHEGQSCNGSGMSIFMQYRTGNIDFLLTCTSEVVGVCYLLNPENLDIVSDNMLPSGSSDPHVAYIGSRTSAVALQVPGKDFIYSAISDTGMTSTNDVFTFSERWLRLSSTRYVMKYSHWDSSAYIKSKPGTQFQFVNGFLSTKYAHFLWNHISSYNKKAQINQVCIDDIYFRSYIETDLQCGRYAVLKSAATLNINGSLFLVTSFTNPENLGTALCLFKVEDIDRHFNDERKKCFSGGHGVWPNWIAGVSQTVCQTPVNKSLIDCGQSSKNPRITASKVIKRDPFYQTTVSEDTVTSLTFYQHGAKNAVGFIGHVNGTVSKMLVNTISDTYHLLYSVNVTQKGAPLGKDLILSGNKKKLFFTHQNTVASLLVDDCSLLMTCLRCLADVTSCMWEGQCVSLKNGTENMPNIYTGFCPPEIQVTTLVGPLEGGTEVVVRGMMGRSGSHVTVEIGNKSSTMIIDEGTAVRFSTASSPEEQSVNITVSVTEPPNDNASSEIWDVRTHGTIVNVDTFKFKKVEVFVDEIQKAKISGNVTLVLSGQNLNIGSRRRIRIGNHTCANARYSHDHIECRSPVRNETGRIRMTYHVDNANVTGPEIEFVNDPVIRVIHPTTVIRTGGIPIVFKGDNLAGLGLGVDLIYGHVQHPGNDKALKGKCLHRGEDLYCEVPDFSSTFSATQTENDTLNVTLTFVNVYGPMAGVTFSDLLNVVTIVPEPVLDTICHIDRQEDSPMNITFTGQHLRNIEGTQLQILAGNHSCEITEQLDDSVKCKIALNTDSRWTPKFQVNVGSSFSVSITCPMPSVRQVSTNHEGHDSTNSIVYITVAILGLIVLSAASCAVYRGWRKLRRKIDLPYNVYFRRDQGTLSMEDMTQNEPSHNVYHLDLSHGGSERRSSLDAMETWGFVDMETRQFLETSGLLVPKEHLTLGELIGQGNFGCVYKGYLTDPDEKEEKVVAVKTLHRNNPKDMDVEKFLEEALIMRDFHHPNVMALVGICVGVEKLPLVVLPYLKRGDLLTYVRDVNNVPTVKKLVEFGIDVAAGMNYLCGLKFVHRDLAARNCMIDDDLTVKVADFGLSRDIYEKEYYSSCNKKAMLPVKWMSPESLELGLFNYKTDIWSYGIVLWELLTRGMMPYPAVDNWDLLRYLKEGRRLEKPDFCPEGMFKIMCSCWRWEPNERPTFEQLLIEIPELLRSLERAASRK